MLYTVLLCTYKFLVAMLSCSLVSVVRLVVWCLEPITTGSLAFCLAWEVVHTRRLLFFVHFLIEVGNLLYSDSLEEI